MCWYCGEPITDEVIGRSLRCARCGKDLRCCRHCARYLPGARGDCKEANAEPPADKERGNFCDWFALDPRFRAAGARSAAGVKAQAAKAAFDSLFSLVSVDPS